MAWLKLPGFGWARIRDTFIDLTSNPKPSKVRLFRSVIKGSESYPRHLLLLLPHIDRQGPEVGNVVWYTKYGPQWIVRPATEGLYRPRSNLQP